MAESCDFFVLDIDECVNRLNDCDDPRVADCINNPGNFSCVCKSGYTGNGTIGTCQGQCSRIRLGVISPLSAAISS